jgi:hypothetical protein
MHDLVTANGVPRALVLVAGFAVLAGLLRWKLPSSEPARSWKVELGLLFLVPLVCVPLAVAWMAPHHLGHAWALAASDFGEHCQSFVLAGEDIAHAGYSPKRSRIAGWLVAQLGDGPLTAFLNSAAVSYGLLSMGLYGWGRALHGRMAGLCAAVLALSIAPVASLARTLSFYPQFTAVFVVAAASIAACSRWRHPLVFLGAGAAVGSTMLLGLRGLVWFLPLAGMGLLLTVARPWKRIPLRLGLFVLPLVLSWFAGRLAYHEDATSLERLVNPALRYAELGFEGFAPPYTEATHFVWSRTSLTGLPASLQTLAAGSPVEPPADEVWALAEAPFKKHVLPWAPVTLLGLVGAVAALRRSPRRLAALLAGLLPFVAGLPNGVLLLQSDARFMGTTLPFVALLGGLGLAAVAQGLPDKQEGTRPWWGILVGVLLLLVVGVIPSFLSPTASWRDKPGMPPGNREVGCYLRVAEGGDDSCLQRQRPHSPQCVTAFKEESRAGGTFWPIDVPDDTRPGDRR